jgi:hypothetical protein
VFWFVVFLEDREDDELDPDLAVKKLEEIVSSLSTLDPQDRATFFAFCRKETENPWPPDAERTKHLLSLVEELELSTPE